MRGLVVIATLAVAVAGSSGVAAASATGTARVDSDFDIIAMVTDSSTPRLRLPGRPPYKGMPASLDGHPIECASCAPPEVGREEMVEIARGRSPLTARRGGLGVQ